MGYARSPFQDCECYLGIVVGLDEENVQLILKQYIPSFLTYEIPAGIYSFTEFSEAIYIMGDHEWTLQIELNDISMKTNLTLKRFGGSFVTLWLDKNSFF